MNKEWEFNNLDIRGISQSAPEYSLLLKKPPTVSKNSDPLKLGPQKTVLIIAFRICETKHLSTDADSSTDAIGGWTKNTQKPNFFEKRKKYQKR